MDFLTIIIILSNIRLGMLINTHLLINDNDYKEIRMYNIIFFIMYFSHFFIILL